MWNSPYLLQIGSIPLEELLCRSRSSIQDRYRAKWWPEEEGTVRLCRAFLGCWQPNGGDSPWISTKDLKREGGRADRHPWRAEPWPDGGASSEPSLSTEKLGKEEREGKERWRIIWKLTILPKMPFLHFPFILVTKLETFVSRYNFCVLTSGTTNKIPINSPKRQFRLTRKEFLITSSFYVYSFQSRMLWIFG